ncbi:MAG: PQQ-dependent sugar dehydrogenase [Candidatus Methylomirabilales bacterium]
MHGTTRLMVFSMLVLSVVLAATPLAAATVRLELVAGGLTAPTALVSPPDGTKRRFIMEQVGRIRILMPDGRVLPEPFLNVQAKLVELNADFDERGLLGLAFHPDFKNNGRFFVYYSAPLRSDAPLRTRLYWNHTSHVSEFRVSSHNPNSADPNSERILMQIDQPQFNHNGGGLAFGADGYLYVSVGDGGFANDVAIGHAPIGNGQDTSTVLGKILRIDVDRATPYGIPADNPFIGKEGAREEIWAYGLRNPWRMSFDAGGQNELFAADVGQNRWEEVNIITRGRNYGWNRKEGTHCFDPSKPNDPPADCPNSVNGTPLIDPIVEYPNARTMEGGKGRSVTGGYVYRGTAIPELTGHYVFGDWSMEFARADGVLYVAKRPSQAGGKWSMEEINVADKQGGRIGLFVLAFGQDADNELYVLTSRVTGPTGRLDQVYKIVPAK